MHCWRFHAYLITPSWITKLVGAPVVCNKATKARWCHNPNKALLSTSHSRAYNNIENQWSGWLKWKYLLLNLGTIVLYLFANGSRGNLPPRSRSFVPCILHALLFSIWRCHEWKIRRLRWQGGCSEAYRWMLDMQFEKWHESMKIVIPVLDCGDKIMLRNWLIHRIIA